MASNKSFEQRRRKHHKLQPLNQSLSPRQMSKREARRYRRKQNRDEWTVAIQQIQRRMKIRMGFLIASPILAAIVGLLIGWFL